MNPTICKIKYNINSSIFLAHSFRLYRAPLPLSAHDPIDLQARHDRQHQQDRQDRWIRRVRGLLGGDPGQFGLRLYSGRPGRHRY